MAAAMTIAANPIGAKFQPWFSTMALAVLAGERIDFVFDERVVLFVDVQGTYDHGRAQHC